MKRVSFAWKFDDEPHMKPGITGTEKEVADMKAAVAAAEKRAKAKKEK